jgi:hypothetical protein
MDNSSRLLACGFAPGTLRVYKALFNVIRDVFRVEPRGKALDSCLFVRVCGRARVCVCKC